MLTPTLPVTQARDEVHAFLLSLEVYAIYGVHLVRLASTPPDDPRGPRVLTPAHEWDLWQTEWADWLTRLQSKCGCMATDV